MLCPSRKTLSPPDTQQKLSLPWRLAFLSLRAAPGSCTGQAVSSPLPQHQICHQPPALHTACPCPCSLGGTSPCASPGFSPTAGRRSSISALQIIKLMNVSFFFPAFRLHLPQIYAQIMTEFICCHLQHSKEAFNDFF